MGPSETGSSSVGPTAPSGANSPGCAGSGSAGAGGNAARSSLSMGGNSQPGLPLNEGSSTETCGTEAATALANGTLHLQLDQPVHLDRVLHRQLLDDRLDEAVDDELAGLLLVQPVGHEVEELLVADLGDGGLVPDVDVVLADADRRVGVRARVLVEQQRVADDLGLRAVRALGDLEQAAVGGAPAVLGDRLGEDVGRRVGRRVHDLGARVLMLALAREGD